LQEVIPPCQNDFVGRLDVYKRYGVAAVFIKGGALKVVLFTVMSLLLTAALVLACLPNRLGFGPWAAEIVEEHYDVRNVLAERIGELSDEELVGQLFVVGFDGLDLNDATVERLAGLRPAGVILFARNIADADRLRGLTGALQAEAAELGLPGLLIAVDQEGGRVRRLKDGFSSIPAMGELPGRTDPAGAETVGEVIGRELAAVGCNWNLAPVVDVLTNPSNPGIGDRSFSGDPAVVCEYAAAVARGILASGVAVCAKHFPGKGEAAVDAHYDLPVIAVDSEHLEAYEWPPFRALLTDGQWLKAAMVSHVVIPVLDPEKPASLSPAAYDALRGDIGFDGVAVTDDLEMGAIVKNYGLPEAAVMALGAGADLVLICHTAAQMTGARDAVLAALKDGGLEREMLRRHVLRVWLFKLALGLPLPGLADYDRAFEEVCLRLGLDPVERRSLLDNPPDVSVCGSAEHRALLNAALR
jgi:beta-N-acetylhexosaminidase